MIPAFQTIKLKPPFDAAFAYLQERLQGQENRRETIHPWRRRWEFLALHTLRVEAYVRRILAMETHSLNEKEVVTLRLAAYLHDICRIEKPPTHAQEAALVARAWLEANPEIAQQSSGADRLADIIACHSDKKGPEPDYSKSVLKDADTLDEIGAISILMSGNHLDRTSPFFLNMLEERLHFFELSYCDMQMRRLHTEAGRAIMAEKKQFIQAFIDQLNLELEGSHGVQF